ncbi:hypothetical protein FPRO06_10507 [Fusarium proliferatum]|nr:hypothetical protein FPRO06_10507 [Fusarium proliferatum]
MPPATPRHPKSRDDFEIAIICALTLEADAVIASFDHHWDEEGGLSLGKARGDPNSYSTGVIGCHNVVLAHLPGMGKIAGHIASFCRMSFPNISLALIVGICGGAPLYEDTPIFLGDVIISTGVVQYDFGRRFPDRFEMKDTLGESLGRPNLEIRSLLAKLTTARQREKLRRATRDLIALVPNAYPGRSKDVLFPASYRHKHQDSRECSVCTSCSTDADAVCSESLRATCEELGCDRKQTIRQIPGNTDEMEPSLSIHFGTFASGDTVMKSGKDRDQLIRQKKVVGFEMESAGVWEVFPSIVIKSVCDYADSHKNKDWQAYSALCAASCTKAFLEYWNSTKQSLDGGAEVKELRKHILESLHSPEINQRRSIVASETASTLEWIFGVSRARRVDYLSSDDGRSDNDSAEATNGSIGQDSDPGEHSDEVDDPFDFDKRRPHGLKPQNDYKDLHEDETLEPSLTENQGGEGRGGSHMPRRPEFTTSLEDGSVARSMVIKSISFERAPPRWNTPGWLDKKLTTEGFCLDLSVFGAGTLDAMLDYDENIKLGLVKLDINARSKSFAEGSSRVAAYARPAATTSKFVLLESFKHTEHGIANLIEEVRMQAICKAFALEFNGLIKSSQTIDFITTLCLQDMSRGSKSGDYLSLEPLIEGNFVKYNSNGAYVLEDDSNPFNEIAQAFSHFTFKRSWGHFLVTDLQGVGNTFTDPAIQTKDPERFQLSQTNLGDHGFKFFFALHECKTTCRQLGLRTNKEMLISGKFTFKAKWQPMNPTVCCSNKLCLKIIRPATANKSSDYPEHNWCDGCFPQLKLSEVKVACEGSKHNFHVSKFYHESQGEKTPTVCEEHMETDTTATSVTGGGRLPSRRRRKRY